MNNEITIYYYTAWDGFSWQGCSEAEAKSLQLYMEETGTLPKSPIAAPPFGGAVSCKIAGTAGVAVYRYHIREKGDISGRDSLYIALAFIPLDIGGEGVDFVKILELEQLAATKPGALKPEKVSAESLRLPVGIAGPNKWMADSAELLRDYRVLKGKYGLNELSQLFFSKFTQLGFLSAVFQSIDGVNGVESVLRYEVFPEVEKVSAASKALRSSRDRANGRLPEGHRDMREMEGSLKGLEEWVEKQPDYVGLREYYEEKVREFKGEEDKLAQIESVREKVRRLRDDVSLKRQFAKFELKKHRECEEIANAVESLPVMDHNSYKGLVSDSMRALFKTGFVKGAQEFEQELDKCMEALRSCDCEKNNYRKLLDEASGCIRGFEKDNTVLKRENAELKRTIDTHKTRISSLERTIKDNEKQLKEYKKILAHGNKTVYSQDSLPLEGDHTNGDYKQFRWFMRYEKPGSFSRVNWAAVLQWLIICICIGFCAVVFYRMFMGTERIFADKTTIDNGQSITTVQTNDNSFVVQSTQTNPVPNVDNVLNVKNNFTNNVDKIKTSISNIKHSVESTFPPNIKEKERQMTN